MFWLPFVVSIGGMFITFYVNFSYNTSNGIFSLRKNVVCGIGLSLVSTD